METLFANLVEPGDRVLVGVNGVFGTRMVDVAGRCGAEIHTVEAPWGQITGKIKSDEGEDLAIVSSAGYLPASSAAAKAGLGGGNQVSGPLRFDDFSEEHKTDLSQQWRHCGGCEVPTICFYPIGYGTPSVELQGIYLNGFSPRYWAIRIQGITSGTLCDTAACDTLNATYLLSVASEPHPGGEHFLCDVQRTAVNDVCPSLQPVGHMQYELSLTQSLLSSHGVLIYVTLTVFDNGYKLVADWEKRWSDGVRAKDIDNVEMSLIFSGGGICQGSAAQAFLTAVM
jgi:hypothetical protein